MLTWIQCVKSQAIQRERPSLQLQPEFGRSVVLALLRIMIADNTAILRFSRIIQDISRADKIDQVAFLPSNLHHHGAHQHLLLAQVSITGNAGV